MATPWLTPFIVPASLLIATLVGGCTRETRVRASASVTPAASPTTSPQATQPVTLSRGEALATLCDLYATLDVDCDKRLTVVDQRGHCAQPPCALAVEVELGAARLTLTALHHASQLATELAEGISHDPHTDAPIAVDLQRVFQNPVDYLAERIERRYWSALTRTISTSESELRQALRDDKQDAPRREEVGWCRARTPRCTEPSRAPSAESSGGASSTGDTAPSNTALEGTARSDRAAPHAVRYLYIPERDAKALQTYAPLQRTLALRVERVPEVVSPQWVSELTRDHRHGLLALAHDNHGNALPFVVPGGRFNEMYGWDSYFITWGLLQSDKLSLARAMAEHQAYEIVHYGKVLNANRTYYLTRSQPPFFPALVRKVVDASAFLAETPTAPAVPGIDANAVWLERMLTAAEREYDHVWAAPPRRTELCEGGTCLTRYYGGCPAPSP